MLPKRRKPTRSGIRDDDGPLQCKAHLQWIRGHMCAVAGPECQGRIEAHHEHSRGAGGADDSAVPLCAFHHRQRHDMGRDTFAKHHRVNLTRIAAELARTSPHLIRMRMATDDR